MVRELFTETMLDLVGVVNKDEKIVSLFNDISNQKSGVGFIVLDNRKAP